jgi:hypothetical protein
MLLGLNPKFCPTPNRTPTSSYLEAFPNLLRQIQLHDFFQKNNSSNNHNKSIYVANPNWLPPPETTSPEFVIVKNFIHNRILKNCQLSSPNSFKHNLTINQRKLLSDLKNNDTLKLVNTDKNLGPAIMTYDQYRDFCYNHLNSNTYLQVFTNHLESSRQTVKEFYMEFVTHLDKHDKITKKQARIIVHNLEQSELAYFYALPKIHKKPYGLRPIISNVRSPTYGLSKWLAFHLQPYVERTTSYIKNSDDVLHRIRLVPTHQDNVLIAADVQSLYTSIPLEAVAQSIWYFIQGNSLRNNIIKALLIILRNNFFTFDGKMFQQKIGIAMGTPAAPQIANLFVAYWEETRILPKVQEHLIFYHRFIDDVFAIFRDNVNSQHYPFSLKRFMALLHQIPGLSWTYETSTTQATFLDLEIYCGNSYYQTRTHQKTLNLYQYPTFSSAHPPSVQKSMIASLLAKYYLQNSQLSDFTKLVQLLFKRLLARGYLFNPLKLLFTDALRRIQQPKQTVTTPKPKQYFLKIPYDPNGPTRTNLRNQLRLNDLSSLLQSFGYGQVTICYSRPKNLGDILIHNKRTTPIKKTLPLIIFKKKLHPQDHT